MVVGGPLAVLKPPGRYGFHPEASPSIHASCDTILRWWTMFWVELAQASQLQASAPRHNHNQHKPTGDLPRNISAKKKSSPSDYRVSIKRSDPWARIGVNAMDLQDYIDFDCEALRGSHWKRLDSSFRADTSALHQLCRPGRR